MVMLQLKGIRLAQEVSVQALAPSAPPRDIRKEMAPREKEKGKEGDVHASNRSGLTTCSQEAFLWEVGQE